MVIRKWAAAITLGGTFATAVLFGNLTAVDAISVSSPEHSPNKVFNFDGAKDYVVELTPDGTINVQTDAGVYGFKPSNVEFDTGAGRVTKSISSTNRAESTTKVAIVDAWGDGSRVDAIAKDGTFTKQVTLDSSFLKSIPADAEYLELAFDLSGDWQIPDGTYSGRVELQKNIWLEKSLAWDSSEGDPDNDIPNQNYTDIEIVVADGVLTKRIPVAWLKTATFPIYTDATFSFGTKELADVGPSITVDVLPIGTDKSAICWVDNTDATQEGQCIVATVSGTDLTFGSIADYSADLVGANNSTSGACSAGNDRWVVVFSDDADADDGTARVASSTGTAINGYGTAFDFDNGVFVQEPVCTYISTDTIIIGWADITNTQIQAAACTISAQYTLSCGTVVDLRDTGAAAGTDFSCATLDTNKFICQYADNTTGSIYLTAGTVSGTTITLGTEKQVTATAGQNLGHTLISPTTDTFALTWNGAVAGTAPISFALGTVSGTDINLSATTTPLIATTTSFSSLTAIDADSAFLMYQQGATDAGTTFLAAIPIELNFDTLTFSTSTAETIDATTDPGSLHAANLGDGKFAFVWEDDNATNDLFALIGLLGAPRPLAWYQLNFNAASQRMEDISGNGLHGYLQGFTSTTTTGGMHGQALSLAQNLNGAQDRAYVEANSALTLGRTDFSISIWLQTSTTTFASVVAWRANDGVSSHIQGLFTVNRSNGIPGGLGFETWAWSTVATRASSTKAVNDDKWHNGIVTYTASEDILRLYVDGALNSTTSQGNAAIDTGANFALSIGSNENVGPGGIQYFSGNLDDIRIFKRVLTPAEAAAIYYDGLGQHISY